MNIGYARVSKNDHTDLDLKSQINTLKKKGAEKIYIEKQTTDKQSALTKVRGKLKQGDTLIVCELNRLGGTIKSFIYTMEDFFEKGINFFSIKENFDTRTLEGQYALHMFYSVAQMERTVMAEKTKKGLRKAAKLGNVGGRPPIDKKLRQKAIDMYFSNQFTIGEILKNTGIAKSTLYKYVNLEKGE